MRRLILPTIEQYQQTAQTLQETDWAWLEVQVAPANAKIETESGVYFFDRK